MKILAYPALSHSDMFIAMSNSGNTSELISAAEVAKSHGAAFAVQISKVVNLQYRFSTFNNKSM